MQDEFQLTDGTRDANGSVCQEVFMKRDFFGKILNFANSLAGDYYKGQDKFGQKNQQGQQGNVKKDKFKVKDDQQIFSDDKGPQ